MTVLCVALNASPRCLQKEVDPQTLEQGELCYSTVRLVFLD